MGEARRPGSPNGSPETGMLWWAYEHDGYDTAERKRVKVRRLDILAE